MTLQDDNESSGMQAKPLLAHLDAGPEFNAFEKLRVLGATGLAAPAQRGELPMSWWDVGLAR